MCDDFNTPLAFAAIFDLIRIFNSGYKLGKKINGQHKHNARIFKEWVLKQSEVFALFGNPPIEYLKALDDRLLSVKNIKRSDVDSLIEQRRAAREEKNWDAADKIREQLDQIGIVVLDSPEGTTWEVQK